MKKIIISSVILIILILLMLPIYIVVKDINTNEFANTININMNINEFSNIYGYKSENLTRYETYKNSNTDLSKEEIVKRINLYLDYNFYEYDIKAINEFTNLVLVNKYYYLDETYIPKDLARININCAAGYNLYGENEAVSKFQEMCIDASKVGLTIKTVSVYRSYKSQKAIYNSYLKSDSQASVDTYSARAGHSEHQTGLAFDVYNGRIGYTSFNITEEYNWIINNGYKYGFIVRYEKNKTYLTGYKYEPWHLRYVGVEAATYISSNNITLEEYLLNKK